MKRTTVTGTYRFDEVELIQFSISIPTNFRPGIVTAVVGGGTWSSLEVL